MPQQLPFSKLPLEGVNDSDEDLNPSSQQADLTPTVQVSKSAAKKAAKKAAKLRNKEPPDPDAKKLQLGGSSKAKQLGTHKGFTNSSVHKSGK